MRRPCHEHDVGEIPVGQRRRVDVQRLRVEGLEVGGAAAVVVVDQQDVSLAVVVASIAAVVNLVLFWIKNNGWQWL